MPSAPPRLMPEGPAVADVGMAVERPVTGRTMRDFPLSGLERDVMQRREKAFSVFGSDAADPSSESSRPRLASVDGEPREPPRPRIGTVDSTISVRESGRTDDSEEPRQLAWQGLGGALWSDVSTENGSCDEWSPDEDVGWGAPAAAECESQTRQATPDAAPAAVGCEICGSATRHATPEVPGVVAEQFEPALAFRKSKSCPVRISEPARVEIAEPLHGIHNAENHVPGVVAFLKTSDEGSYDAFAAALTLAAEQLRAQARVVKVLTKPTPSGRSAFDDVGADKAQFTTVMLRNLPTNLTQLMLLQLLDSEGFAKQYDFVYVPVDFKKLCSFGYALVNFLSHEVAESAMEVLRCYRNWPIRSSRACSPVWQSPMQGLDAHIQRYRDSPLMHPDVPEKYKPMLFSDGLSITFPAPNKRIKAPRRGVPRA